MSLKFRAWLRERKARRKAYFDDISAENSQAFKESIQGLNSKQVSEVDAQQQPQNKEQIDPADQKAYLSRIQRTWQDLARIEGSVDIDVLLRPFTRQTESAVYGAQAKVLICGKGSADDVAGITGKENSEKFIKLKDDILSEEISGTLNDYLSKKIHGASSTYQKLTIMDAICQRLVKMTLEKTVDKLDLAASPCTILHDEYKKIMGAADAKEDLKTLGTLYEVELQKCKLLDKIITLQKHLLL